VALEGVERITVTVESESGEVGDVIRVPVFASTAYALSGYDLTLRFDPAILRAISAAPGTVVSDSPQDFEVGDGYIQVSMGRKEALTEVRKAVNVILATVDFEILAIPEGSGTSEIRIDSPALKGQYGDSFDWYTNIGKEYGTVTVFSTLEGESEGEGEGAEEGEGETVTDPEGEVDSTTARDQLSTNFDASDTDNDGQLSYEEALAATPTLSQDTFDDLDANNDGLLSPEEVEPDTGGGGICGGGKKDWRKSLGDWLWLGVGLVALLTSRKGIARARKP
jgi:hypothetical protein